jgi:hypothetical protein
VAAIILHGPAASHKVRKTRLCFGLRLQDVRVAFAEARQGAGARADEPDLERPRIARCGARQAAWQRRGGECGESGVVRRKRWDGGGLGKPTSEASANAPEATRPAADAPHRKVLKR